MVRLRYRLRVVLARLSFETLLSLFLTASRFTLWTVLGLMCLLCMRYLLCGSRRRRNMMWTALRQHLVGRLVIVPHLLQKLWRVLMLLRLFRIRLTQQL